jgi:CheY-like chemotaxis protein
MPQELGKMRATLTDVQPIAAGAGQSAYQACIHGCTYRWIRDGRTMHSRKVPKIRRHAILARAALVRSRLKKLNSRIGQDDNAGLAEADFVSHIRHEIGTPINDIIGTLDLLLDTELTLHQRGLASAAQAGANRLLALINAMLDFTLIEAGAFDLRQIPFDLQHEVKADMEAQLLVARGKGIELTVHYAPVASPPVIGDPLRIRQVIANLVSHAVERCTHHEIRIEITVTPAVSAACCISVTVADAVATYEDGDTAAEVSDQAGESKAGLSDTDCTQGAGERLESELKSRPDPSLALAKRLSELMGGRIGIDRDSAGGRRLWFCLTVPLAPNPLAGVRVLFLDAHGDSRRMLQAELARHDMRTDGFDTATAALSALGQAAAEGDPYRLAILDHQIQGFDGELLGAAIKGDPACRDTLLVLLSSADPGQAARLAQAGFAAFLSKPANPATLINTLTALCAAVARREIPPFLTDNMRMTASRDARPFAGHRVLVADHNLIHQQVAARMLEKLGCDVDIAANSHQAVAMHRTHRYAAILMGCEMPELDGYRACAQIRAAEAGGRRAAIIGCSAYATHIEHRKCMAAGMDDFMVKPLRAQTLRDMLACRLGSALQPTAPGMSAGQDELAAIQKIFGAGFVELAALFQVDTPPRIAALRQAAADGDTAQLARLAHALSGSTSSIGATSLAILCKELEADATAGAVENVHARLAAIEQEYLRIDARLRSIMAGIHE